MTRARAVALPAVVVAALAGALVLSAGPAIGAGAHRTSALNRSSAKATEKAPAAISATVGIGDDSPGMFSNSDFTALRTRIARYVTPYDVIVHPNVDALGRLREWLSAASRAHIQV